MYSVLNQRRYRVSGITVLDEGFTTNNKVINLTSNLTCNKIVFGAQHANNFLHRH